MAKPKALKAVSKPTAKAYDHAADLPMRPDVGLQAQFRQKKPPAKYQYDQSLDPQLVWAGKAEHQEFDVPTLPLFVHERLSTEAILKSVEGRKPQKTLNFFGDNQLDLTDRVLKAYQHREKWRNRLILGDSLHVMNSLLRYEGLGGQVQMVFIDPPYGVKFGSNFQPYVKRREVKHGADADFSREPEMVQAYRDTWELGIHSYLTYLRDRLLLSRDLLSPSGSIFVQISDDNLHHVRELMDEVFSRENFLAVIVFQKTSTASGELLPTVCDYLLWYAKDADRVKTHRLYLERTGEGWVNYDYVRLPDGTHRRMTGEERSDWNRLPPGARVYRRDNLTSQRPAQAGDVQSYQYEGKTYTPGGRTFATDKEGLDRLGAAGRLESYGSTLSYRRFAADFPFLPLTNEWTDTRTGGYAEEKYYVVQTTTKVVQRCVLLATDPGDLVLDPTCGSGTTAYVCEEWGRRWITIDTSRVPLALARQRLLTATFPYYQLRDEKLGPAGGFHYARRQNKRGEEIGGLVPRVSLTTMARALEPEVEIIVDRPETRQDTVRVTGPLTVEATIPAPSLPVDGDAPASVGDDNFLGRMLQALKRSPVLRLPGGRTAELQNVRSPPRSLDIHALADLKNGELSTVAVAFGPENGAITAEFIHRAAQEANVKKYSRLFVIGFAIQDAATKHLGHAEEFYGIPVTYVQATMDLLMGDLLKTTKASQIFSVAGLPDVELKKLKKKGPDGDALYQVRLAAVDTFDPITMEPHTLRGDDVPSWMLDSDFDELSFRANQVFFPRTGAWDNLKRELKGVFDDSLWDHLAGTESEPFAAGDRERIAVKVIDERGNELLVVKDLKEAIPE